MIKLEELGRCGEVEGAQVLLKEVEALEKDREKERAGLMRDSSKVGSLTVLWTLNSLFTDPCRI